MPSQRYIRMRSQVKQLQRALLPRNINKDIIDLTPRMSLRALSFRILCHAEFEHYIEERAIEIAMIAEKSWKERGHISRTTFCLLAFSGRSLAPLPETLKAPPKKKQTDWSGLINPSTRLSECISHFTNSTKNKNNGIKESNIISMLLPLGFDPEKLDEALIADLNDFGTKRGEAAHISTSGHLKKGINPKDEHDQVKRIISALIEVDRHLDEIVQRAR